MGRFRNALAIFTMGLVPMWAVAGVDYNSEIQQPILDEKCASCHGSSGGLNLSSYSNLMAGGNHGVPVVPYDAEGSILVDKISSDPSFGSRMPKDDPTYFDAHPEQLQLIKDWIDEGAFEAPQSQSVIVDLGDVEVDAYPPDAVIPVGLTNPGTPVGGLQLDVVESPEMLSALTVEAVGPAAGFSVSFANLESGALRIVLVSTSGENIAAGSDEQTVLNIHYDAGAIASAVVGMAIENLVVADPSGEALEASAEGGSLEIGSTVSLGVTGGTADAGETVDILVSLTNEDPVGGFQIDLDDSPNLVTIDSVWVTGRASAFTVGWNEVGGAARVVVWSAANDEIPAGEGDVVGLRAVIDSHAHMGDIALTFENVVVSDLSGGSYWVASLGSGVVTVYPGYLEPPQNLTAQSGLDGEVPLVWEAPSGGGGGQLGGILLVDDDNSVNNGGPYEADVASHMAAALTAAGYAFDEFVVVSASDGPDGETISGYDLVIWMTGYEWGYGPTLTDADQATLTAYLNGGGNAWVIGEDIPYNIGTSNPFLTEMMGLASITEEVGNPDPFVGVDGTFMEGASYPEADIGFPDGPWGDDLTPGSTATGVLQSIAENYSAVSNDPGTYRSVYWGVEFAFITAPGDEADCVSRTLEWFGSGKVNGKVGPQRMISDSRGTWRNLTAAPIARLEAATAGLHPSSFQFAFDPADAPEGTGREVDAFNIYRSATSGGPYSLLTSVDGQTLSYTDESVTNGTWYYYAVSADYGAAGESEYSNEASALPAEWVSLSATGGAAISGQTDTVWVHLANASSVGDVAFKLNDVPNYLEAEGIVTTSRTGGYAATVAEVTGGSAQVALVQTGSPISAGTGAICGIIYRAASTVDADVSISFSNAEVSSPTGLIYAVATEGTTFQVYVETQYVMLSGGYAAPGTQGTIELSLSNTQPIFGFELFIQDLPNVLTGVSIAGTGRIPSTMVLSGADAGGVYWVTAVDLGNRPIAPGNGPIATITFSVSSSATPETVVDLSFASSQFWDTAGNPILTQATAEQFAVGIPEALFTFGEGGAPVGGSGTYTIDLANSVSVYGFQVFVQDFPNWLTVTNVEKTSRLPSDAYVSWNEFTDGTLRVLEFDLTPPIQPIGVGSGPILTVTVQAAPEAVPGMIGLGFTQAIASDAAGDPTIFSFGIGDWFSIGSVGVDRGMGEPLPTAFTLHQNYPNPFNPATMVAFDLPVSEEVRVSVLNLLGQEVAVLSDGYLPAGRHRMMWDGRDQSGAAVNSGVYLCQVRSRSFNATRKMTLLK